MRLRSEIKVRRRAPAPDFDVVVGTVTDRNAVVRQVRNAGKNLAQPDVEIGRGLFQTQ